MNIIQISHVHLFVKDRPEAVRWLKEIWGTVPDAEDHEMSLFSFGSTQIVVNDSDEDIQAIIAFESTDCVQDYDQLIGRGAVSISAPKAMPWGVKSAFVQGPGKITFEVEEPMQRSPD